MGCDSYLISIIKAVIHKPGDKWSFAHCGGKDNTKQNIRNKGLTAIASQNLVSSLQRQHGFCVKLIKSNMLWGREGMKVCRMSLNSVRRVGNMGVAVLLSQQHNHIQDMQKLSLRQLWLYFWHQIQLLWNVDVDVTLMMWQLNIPDVVYDLMILIVTTG